MAISDRNLLSGRSAGTLPVYGPLKVRGFGFMDSGCHLLGNLLSERRPEAAA